MTEMDMEAYASVKGFSDRWNQPRFATSKKRRVKRTDCRVAYPGKPFEDCIETINVTQCEYYLKREYQDLTISATCWASTPHLWTFSINGVPKLRLSTHDCSLLYRALSRFLRDTRQERTQEGGEHHD